MECTRLSQPRWLVAHPDGLSAHKPSLIQVVTWGAIHERAYDRYRAYAGRTPKFTMRRLFTKPVVRTKFVQLLSIERKFYDRGEAVVRIA